MEDRRRGKLGLLVGKDVTVPQMVTLTAPILSHTFNKCLLLLLLFRQEAEEGASEFLRGGPPSSPRRKTGWGGSRIPAARLEPPRTPRLPSGGSSRFLISQEIPNQARTRCCFQSPRQLGVSSLLCKIGEQKKKKEKPGRICWLRCGTRLRTGRQRSRVRSRVRHHAESGARGTEAETQAPPLPRQLRASANPRCSPGPGPTEPYRPRGPRRPHPGPLAHSSPREAAPNLAVGHMLSGLGQVASSLWA